MTTETAHPFELVLERKIHAPRSLVWRVLTSPELIPKWWGRTDFLTTVLELDLRTGGTWRFVQVGTGGTVHPYRGSYDDVTAMQRLRTSFVYDVPDARTHTLIEDIRLDDGPDGTTHVASTLLFVDETRLQSALLTGMQRDCLRSLDRLEQAAVRLHASVTG